MKLKVKLTKEDFLVHQLYAASHSVMIKKKRAMSRLLIPIIYIGVGVYFYFQDDWTISYVFCGIAVLWFFVYPLYSRRRYKRHFRKYVEENFKNKFDNENEWSIDKEFIRVKDEKSESKVSIQEVKQLVELADHFLIKLRSGLSIIIPKHIVPDKKYFRREFESLGIERKDDTNWKWR